MCTTTGALVELLIVLLLLLLAGRFRANERSYAFVGTLLRDDSVGTRPQVGCSIATTCGVSPVPN